MLVSAQVIEWYIMAEWIIDNNCMGSCLNGNSFPQGLNTFFHEDVELQPRIEIFNPLTTSLYNLMRRNHQLVVLYPNYQHQHRILSLLQVNLTTLAQKDMKLLLNFKRILFVGDFQTNKDLIINKIKPFISYSKFYVISQAYCSQFLREYKVFEESTWKKHALQPRKLPILAIDSRQFIQKSEPRIKVYIHSATQKDLHLYSLLSVQGQQAVINDTAQTQRHKVKEYYLRCLKNHRQKNIILLHTNQVTPQEILQILSAFLVDKFKFKQEYSFIYLKKSLPSANLPDRVPQPHSQISHTSKDIVDTQTKFRNLFVKLQGQAGVEKTQRAYNLLCTLIVNIYSNPTSEQYRRVKLGNKQMNQLLRRYKNGGKLLNELGFDEKEEHWVNNTQSKYLKIFKTNFDIGFKRYKSGISE